MMSGGMRGKMRGKAMSLVVLEKEVGVGQHVAGVADSSGDV